MLEIAQSFQRSKYRKSCTMKFPNEKVGFLKKAREKVAALTRQTHSRNSSIEYSIPSIKIHLTYTETIAQPRGDE